MSTSASSKLACAAKDKRLKPRAMVAVDLFGLAADYEALNAFCDAKVLLLIADVTAQPTQHSGPRNR
jgi:dTDP-4-amino-4,6-dideoxygalactose transaminase